MKRYILVLFFSINMLGLQTGSASRNMSVYEQSGPYVLSIDKPQTEWTRTLAAVRQFIWIKFIKHQHASAKVTFINIEGQSNILEFFVEPGEKDNWIVSVDQSSESGNRLNGTYKVIRSTCQSSLLNWISSGPREQTDSEASVPASNEDKRFFENHKLQLVSEDKKILIEF